MILTLSNARGEVLNVAGATFENYQALRPIMAALGVQVELTDDLGRRGIASGKVGPAFQPAETPPRTPLGELLFHEGTTLAARAAKAWYGPGGTE